MRSWAAAAAAAVLLGACGEPPVAVDLPARDDGRHLADLAGVLDDAQRDDLQARLAAEAADGLDIVALTYEAKGATCGEAYRAANEFVAAWDADVALVAVARPGDFASTASDRRRCVGVQPRDDRAIAGDLRERIAEQVVPPHTARNDWHGALTAAVDALGAP